MFRLLPECQRHRGGTLVPCTPNHMLDYSGGNIMKKHLPPHMCAMCVLAMAVLLAAAAQAQTATINLASNQQTIDGFGFSILRIRIDPNESWGNEPSNSATAHSHGAKVLGTPWTPPASMKNNNSTICGDLLSSQYGAYASHLNRAV